MTEQAASPVPDEQPASPVPIPSGERDERDWEERRRVAVEAWKLGQRLAASRSSQTRSRESEGGNDAAVASPPDSSEVALRCTPLWHAQHEPRYFRAP